MKKERDRETELGQKFTMSYLNKSEFRLLKLCSHLFRIEQNPFVVSEKQF